MIQTASPTIARGHTRTSVSTRRGGSRIGRWTAATIAVTFALVVHLGASGTEMADSGWQVAAPLTVLDAGAQADPAIRIAINQVLRETQVPLLQSPPSPAHGTDQLLRDPAHGGTASREPAGGRQPADEQTATSERALRPLSTDGWRSVAGARHQPSVPVTGSVVQTPPTNQSQDAAEADATSAPHVRPTTQPTIGNARATKNLGPLMRAAGVPAPAETSPGEQVPSPPTAEPTVERSGFGVQGTEQTSLNPEPRSVNPEPSSTDSTTSDAAPTATERAGNQESGDVAADAEPGTVEITDELDNQPPLDDEPAAKPLPPLSRNMRYLRNKVRRVLKGYYNKPLNSRDHDPWEMMHGMLAYGLHSQVRQDGPRGQLITSVGWLCYNKPCKGLTLLYVTPNGELRAKYGVGLQGHMGQFLAMLAQCKVSPEYPIRVGQSEFTIHDLVEAEQKTCYQKEELTFKLISLMHYLESDAKWVNDQGVEWDIQKLIREELAQPIRGAACGGTHRLAGLSLAARTRVARGEPLDGEFARAAAYVQKYHNYAFRQQNRDGSLSTEWFRGRGDEDDIDRRVKTTGHILEWLIYSLSDEELQYSRTVNAVNYLANLLYSNYDHEWEIGPRSHAIHALALYDERVFQPYDDQEDVVSGPTRRPTTSRSPSRSRQR
jgi:hypothetical protein